jgi:hypothetical protein
LEPSGEACNGETQRLCLADLGDGVGGVHCGSEHG